MKPSGFFIFFALLLLTSVNLTAGFWVKHLAAGNQQIRYEAGSGMFLSLKPEYTIFDIKGTIYRQGIFKRGNREWIELQETISLPDNSFFSLAYSYDENGEIIGYYKVTRFSWLGDVLFVKGIKVNTRLFQLGKFLRVEDKIKLLGYEDPGNLIGNVVILNFTQDGEFPEFRRFALNTKTGRFYSSEAAFIETDADHYLIIKTGEIRVGNNLLKGIHLMKFTVNDDLAMIKSYYNPDEWGGHFETPVITKDPESGYMLLLVERINDNGKIFRTPHLLKFDENWQLKWSRAYRADTPLPLMKGAHLLPGEESYTICLNKSVTVNEEPVAKPVLIRTDSTGAVSWSKKYEYGGTRGICSILNLNNGGLMMSTHNRYFYLLNGSGDVPGSCSAISEISLDCSATEFVEKLIENDRVTTSIIPVSMTDYNGFFDEYEVAENDGAETFCLFSVLQGEFDTVIERSRFSGYLVHRLRFSVDPSIASYISKFHVYRKFSDPPPGDYEFVSQVDKIEGQADYKIEYRPFVLGKSFYSYKIIAYNPEGEIIDYAFLK
ncbi:MAG: hypothetical protein KAT34_19015 [Candidatus Aminicenantes bacterium]|nr:hypothetical protein [Candidatus Aminicenantes bacterium]